MNSLTLLPLFSIRIAGINANNLKLFNSFEIIKHSIILEDIKKNIEKETDFLVRRLYHNIACEFNPKKRIKILELRRDIRNEKKIRKLSSSNLSTIISNDEIEQIKNIVLLYNKLEFYLIKFNELFQSELTRIREIFKSEVLENNFLLGVALSSENLFKELKSYLNCSSNQLTKKERNIEETLLNYYKRASTKTSPFATFTSISINKSHSNAEHPSINFSKKNILMLDRIHLGEILDELKKINEIRDELIVFYNPTLVFENNSYFYCFEQKPSFKVDNKITESLSFVWNIQSSDSLTYVLKFIKKHNVTYKELIQHLVIKSNVGTKKVIAFIEELVSNGIIELNYPVSELNHKYFEDMLAFFNKIKNDNQIVKNLEVIYSSLNNLLEIINYDQLVFKTNEIKNLIYEIRLKLNIPNRNSPIIYLDSCLSKFKYNLKNEGFDLIKDDLDLLNKLGTYFKISEHIKLLNIKHVLLKNWGSKEDVGLIKFFDRYIEIMSQYYDKEQRNLDDVWNPFELDEIELLKDLQNRLINIFCNAIELNDNEIHLDKEVLKQLISQAPSFVKFGNFFSVYLQKGCSKDSKWVLNEIRDGNYRYMSRFIYLTQFIESFGLTGDIDDSEVLNQIKCRENNTLFAELGGVFFSNNNVHRPITEYKIAYPNCYYENSDKIIFPNDLIIKIDADGLPILFSKKLQKRVIPIHIGLNNEAYFPKFYQFILSFELNKPFFPKPNALFKSFIPREVTIPRVILGNIIISRKRWYLRKDRIPYKDPKSSDSDYFLTLDKWRRDTGLPEQVFLTKLHIWVVSESDSSGKNQKQIENKKTKVKPQFFNFSSPLIMSYFQRFIKDLDGNRIIVFEECYPNTDELTIAANGEKYVSEFFFELSYNDKNK